MAYSLLGAEKNTIKERGIEFIQDVYDVMWSFVYKGITDNRTLFNQYTSGFPLFAEICMDELNIESVEKRIKFGNLADSVQRVAIWLRYDKKNKENDKNTEYRRYEYNVSSEINELNSFARHIGYYLGKQKNKNNIVNHRVWADVLNRWNFFQHIIFQKFEYAF